MERFLTGYVSPVKKQKLSEKEKQKAYESKWERTFQPAWAKTAMAGLQPGMQLTAQQQVEESMKPFREFLSQYNKITEKCFNDCITDFTTKNILNSENSCSLNCLEKTLKATQRISERFQEHQMLNVDDPTAAAVQTLGK